MGIIKGPLKCGEIKGFDPCGGLIAVIVSASPLEPDCPQKHLENISLCYCTFPIANGLVSLESLRERNKKLSLGEVK